MGASIVDMSGVDVTDAVACAHDILRKASVRHAEACDCAARMLYAAGGVAARGGARHIIANDPVAPRVRQVLESVPDTTLILLLEKEGITVEPVNGCLRLSFNEVCATVSRSRVIDVVVFFVISTVVTH